jgi:hypothetical protein
VDEVVSEPNKGVKILHERAFIVEPAPREAKVQQLQFPAHCDVLAFPFFKKATKGDQLFRRVPAQSVLNFVQKSFESHRRQNDCYLSFRSLCLRSLIGVLSEYEQMPKNVPHCVGLFPVIGGHALPRSPV